MKAEQQDSLQAMEQELIELRQAKAELEALNNAALRIEQKLEESEEQYRSVTETSIDAVITADAAGRILTWNRGAEQMFGFGREIIGEPIVSIIPEPLREAHLKGFARFLETGEKKIIDKRVEQEGLKSSGDVFPIELSLSTWTSYRGRFFGAIIRDISERKKVERIREDVERMIRHDLKSPLIGIAGFAGLLLKADNIDDRQRKYIQLIKELSEKMYASINRSLDLFKMEQGIYKLQPAPFNLFKIFADINNLAGTVGCRKSVRVAFFQLHQLLDPEQMEHMEYTVVGEENLIEVAIENLVKNAIEASPDGGEVKISLLADADSHIIDIHNQGAIPSEIRSVFFEPYVTFGKQGGTGLGTHSAKLVISAHGGDVSFTTSETEGTHVVLKLPKLQGPRQSSLEPAPQQITQH